MVNRVPLVDLAAQEASVAAEVLAAIAAVAAEGRFILGERVEAFERWLAGGCGVPHAVALASGTDALVLGLRALGVGPGDAVVTPALSFVAAAEAVAVVGARPIFCDVDPRTMNASEETVIQALDRGRAAGHRVRALLPVHLFGRCAPSEALVRLASTRDAWLVEDAAQALGARHASGVPAGGLGAVGCFSFFPTKNLGAWGDGGALVTSRKDVFDRVRRLRAHGAVSPYVHAELGCNSRLDALQAAVLLTKTRHLDDWQKRRTAIALRYAAELARLPLTLPTTPEPPAVHAWHAYVIRCERRDALARWLGERGIDARVYYPVPLHQQRCFDALDPVALPVAEGICRTALALPIFPLLSEAQQAHVIAQIRLFFDANADRGTG